jgi:hypothetical protein
MRLPEAHILGAPLKPAVGLSGTANGGAIALLTLAVLLIHGYHPFAEDAEIYVAGVRKLADPSLYQHDAPFVLVNTHFSLFARLGAATLRITHIPLDWLLLLTHLGLIFAFLLACWVLARRIFTSSAAQWSAVILPAAFFSLPLAGTSLMLMDPYITARSFTTPLSLFALAAAIDRRWIPTVLLLLLTGLMHPLMTIYAAAFILLFILTDLGHTRLALILTSLGIIACGGIELATRHAPISRAWRQAVLSRRYLFPSEWAWYEDLGLAIPLLLYALAIRRLGSRTLTGKLCLAAIMLGTSSSIAAFLFVHLSGPYLLASLQPLRAFHILYLLGIVLLGGLIGHTLWTRPVRRPAACTILAAAALAMFLTARCTYRASDPIELPGLASPNPWQQAFLWVRANTPRDAVFAANSDLVLLRGEDGQSFRVMAGRSLLANYKDGGVAVIFPELAPRWATEYNAQNGIDRLSDTERLARLRPLGVTWLLLSRDAATSFPCPWHNSVAQVCRIAPAQK